ncbi:GCN5-related N-acetyltransferase [Caldicellulosiruptor acetigenus 6A]|uniref:GCN5-related N-acetyltransferase n=1 Tax=Caldicellulosiruptor acetigenus 6A TaxID=632516 RepID=G2PX91_9FIRM|nr:GCN5-related N-acetyltransferase [Caldicellulosiruptor acetigenus 6A]
MVLVNMITKLSAQHFDKLMEFVRKEREWNIFIIGDVLSYGFDSPVVQVWGEFDLKTDSIKAVLLQYRKDLIFYSDTLDYDIEGFSNIILNLKFKTFSGKKSAILPFAKKIKFSQKREQSFSKLSQPQDFSSFNLKPEEENMVKIITKDNIEENLDKIDMLVYLYQSIEEFLNPATFDQIKQDVSLGRSRIYYIEEDDMIVSSARTGAEIQDMAMVISVCTMHEYRGKGYATMCMKKLCSDLLSEGKSLCLFYENPAAGRIYKKLGFEELGKWVTFTV